MKRSIVAAGVVGLAVVIGLILWYFLGARMEQTTPRVAVSEPAATAVRPLRSPSSSVVYPVSFGAPEKMTTSKTALLESSSPGTTSPLDLKEGFRDVAFGSADSNLTYLVLINEDEARQLKNYTRTGDLLELNGRPLGSIEYTFFKGQFFQATLRWRVKHPDNPDFEPLVNILARECHNLYGLPKEQTLKKDSSYFVWRGRKVEIVLAGFIQPGDTNVLSGEWDVTPAEAGRMIVLNLPLRQAADKFAAERVQKNASSF